MKASKSSPFRFVLGALAASFALVSAGATAQEILTSRAPNREQLLIEGARKEGQVVLYSAAIVNQALRPMAAAFMKKYPFVKLTYWRGDTEEIVAKLSAEVRAKNVVADLVEGTGVGELAVEAGLTVPFTTPAADELPEQYRDPRGNWVSTRISYFGIAYNTRLVPPDQVPKSYDDLLDPRWKGKLAWRIGTSSGTPLFLTGIRLARGEEEAARYFDKLSEQKIVNFGSGSARTLVDRVIAGEFPIALNIFAHHPLISKAKGAPVNSQLLEPVNTTAGTMVVPKGVKHPHAAMLLADFIVSKEGQEIFAKAEYFPVRTDVAPLEVLAPIVPKTAGVKELFVSSETLNRYTESSQKIFEDKFR
ncbi:MAG: extracellular solute-binding protein [Beijerinckiaceae bacterium]|nr:extracellular solute-binding protein [Beijerinckiaceae bacterium]MDO9442147.1 extracellular solute-binding protein [Beijerinckiaceae bacterium]